MRPLLAPPADRAALRKRLLLMALASLAWIGGMGWRLVDLQVVRRDQMRGLAADQQERQTSLDARRGLILDRTGRELAMSIEVDSIYADQASIDNPALTAQALAPALDLRPYEGVELAQKLTGTKQFVWVRRKVDPALRDKVAALGLKGIGFTREHKRFYPHGDLAAHVLGFVGMDNQGMEGVEKLYDPQIRGVDGKLFALRDARGKRFMNKIQREASPGHAVVLTLDATIQHLAQRALRRAMKTTGSAAGSVLVMEPSTGDLLALANEPTYNPNRPGASPADSRRNRAVADVYEPGSTFKVVTMAAALEEGLVRPQELFDCQNGSIRVGRQLIRDHKPFGLLTATEVLERSSNVGAIKIGLRLPEDSFYDYITRFGFGARTGIQLPGEVRGRVREPKEWSGVSQATLSFGQELSVTPLQLLTAISAVANDGMLQPPRLVLRELDGAGQIVHETPQAAPRRVISSATAATLKRMMQAVVDEGTATAARMPGYSIAGKTGTAQKIGEDRTYAAGLFVASFAGFVPASRPALVMLVVLDEPAGSLYHGGDIAAPVFREIALPALRYLGVPPEPDRLRDGEEEAIDEDTLLAADRARGWEPPRPPGARPARREDDRKEPEEEWIEPAPAPLPAPASVVAGSQVLLPDLEAHSLRAAVSYLSRIGLTARLAPAPAASKDRVIKDIEQGVVIAQQPEAGATLAAGSVVWLQLGRPEPRPASEEDQPEEAAGSRATRSARGGRPSRPGR